MKRNTQFKFTDLKKIEAHKKRIAYHESGHAVAIYLYNKYKKLPPVFFSITINDFNHADEGCNDNIVTENDDYIARVEGGRLIETLPDSIEEVISTISHNAERPAQSLHDYMTAFEADIVNLLAGSIAEAKHVAICDDEIFNINLINVDALHHCGGSSDLQLVHDYLSCFSSSAQEREQKLSNLYAKAFDFVNDYSNWRAIIRLANYIIDNDKKTIDCDDVFSVLNKEVTCLKQRVVYS